MLFGAHGYWPVLISYSVGLFFLIGAYAALFTYMGESYPTRIRGTGAAFINAMGPVGAIFGSLAFTISLGHTGAVYGNFYSRSCPVAMSGILMFGARSIKPSEELETISQ